MCFICCYKYVLFLFYLIKNLNYEKVYRKNKHEISLKISYLLKKRINR